jgi:hypothetical protein
VTGNYKTQYYFTSSSVYDSPTPPSGWFDAGSSITASVSSPVSGGSGILYVCTGWAGSGSVPSSGSATSVNFTIYLASSITWNWKTQYQVTFSQTGAGSDFKGNVLVIDGVNYNVTQLPVSLWLDSGSNHTFAYQSPLVVTANAEQYVWTATAGLSTSQSGSITVSNNGTVTGNYKTQYYFTSSSVYDSPTPPSGWFDAGSSITASVSSPVSGGSGILYVCTGWAGSGSVPSSGSATSVNFTIYLASSITWNWKTQYQVTFSQKGIGSDFTGTMLTIDGTNYAAGALPVSFWWDSDSSHTFSFASPLTVNASKSYVWSSTSGLSSLQSGTLNITSSGNVTGKYVVHFKYKITFDPGVGTDFTGTVVIIDGTNYNVTELPVSFWWLNGSVHTFAFQSPLVVTPNGKQYVWISTSGLSTAQSGSITVLSNGTVIGDYKTQYYLTLATSPSGVASPSGSGWYDNDTNATISTPAFVNITIGSSRYRFNGWTTSDMTEISNSLLSPTEVRMDKAKTVTAMYVTQYWVTFTEFGVGSDFTGNVTTIDIQSYTAGMLPRSFWWDNGSTHDFTFNSALEVASNTKRYAWTSTNGLSNLRTGTLTVTASGTVNGNYNIQYLLTVVTAPSGLSPQPSRSLAGEAGSSYSWWYDASTSVTLTAKPVTGCTFKFWDVGGSSQGNGTDPITVSMNGPHTATAHYQVPANYPVGGYSFTLTEPAQAWPLAGYATILMIFGAVITLIKRKRK